MTVIPIFNSLLNLKESSTRSSCSKLILDLSSNHPSLIQYSHFAILATPQVIIKITSFHPTGSLRDLIYKNEPLIPYSKKPIQKGAPLPLNQILSFSQQILKGLAYLHKNNWYHLHLHSGNVLVNAKEDKCFMNDVENSLLDIPIRHEKYIHYVYEFFNNESMLTLGKSDNNTILSEILISINLFEKIDVVLFGRMLYEMAFGKELVSNAPEESELKELNPKLRQVFSSIFPKKYLNEQVVLALPEKSAGEILNLLIGKTIEESNEFDNSEYNALIDYDKYSWIKEKVFKQSEFIKRKLKDLNDNEIDTYLI